MSRKAIPTTRTIALQGDLDVFSIHQQWEQLQPLLSAEKGTVELDLSGIGDLDLSGVQLLFALERDLKDKGVELKLPGTQPEWLARFTPLGMSGLFSGDRA